MSDNKHKKIFNFWKITIEKDGWVYVTSSDGKHEAGLGDIDVDIKIEDKRPKK